MPGYIEQVKNNWNEPSAPVWHKPSRLDEKISEIGAAALKEKI